MSKRFKELVKDDNVDKALRYLTEEKGIPRHIASGIIGNLMQESGQNLNIQALNEDDGGEGVDSYGIAQWQGTRLDDLKRVAGDKMNTLEGQLDFMVWEFENTEKHNYKKVMQAEDAEEAALLFSRHYERPYEPSAHNDKRMRNAAKVFARTQGKTVGDIKIPSIDEKEDRTTTKDNIPEVKETRDQMNKQLAHQNELLQQKISNYQQEEATEKKQEKAKSKAQAAQAKLNQKMQQKEMLKQLIMQSGVDFVESPRRRREQAVQPQQAQQYKHGGEHEEEDFNFPYISEEKPVYPEEPTREVLPEVVVTHDKSDYATKKAKEQERILSELDRKMNLMMGESNQEARDPREEINRAPSRKEMKKEELERKGRIKRELNISEYKTDEEVRKLQKMLKEEGYDLGDYGTNNDGVDGIIGKKTTEATDKYNTAINSGEEAEKIFKEVERKEELRKKLESGILTLEEEEEIKRNSIPTSGKLEDFGNYLYDNIGEHVKQPIRNTISSVLPHSLQTDTKLQTVGKYNNTPGTRKVLIDDHSIADIRKEENISFGQISKNGRLSSMVLPERLKERVVNSTYPQGYQPDIDQSKEGLEKFDFFNRLMSEESKDGQVKRLAGKRGDYREDIYRMYSGLPQKYDTFTISSFEAGADSDSNITFKDPETVADYALVAATKTDLFKRLANGEITPESIAEANSSGAKGGDKIHKAGFRDPKNVMWNATFGVGFDKAGNPYLSFYDNWDLAGKDDGLGSMITDKAASKTRQLAGDFAGDAVEGVLGVHPTMAALDLTKSAFGAPIEIYDRIPLTKEMIQRLSKVKNRASSDTASDRVSEEGEKDIYKELKKNKDIKGVYKELLDIIKNRY